MRWLGFLLLVMTGSAINAQNTPDDASIAEVKQKVAQMHGNSLNTLLIGERLEQQTHDGKDNLVWEAQGWVGRDFNKLWFKTEGHYDSENNDTEEFEVQALWSHAISPFWDLQMGLRHDFEPDVSRDYAVVGLMGLAPYWFEVDAAAFLNDEGHVSTRLEAEYDLRFSQRLILQPRMELNYAFNDDLEAGFAKGLYKSHLGLRLRYEVKREFAPYIGVTWEKSFGETANLLSARGLDNGEVSWVMGFRAWY